MALPTPTMSVASSVTLTLNDLLPTNNPQALNRIVPPLNFKASDVQYQGYIHLAPSNTFTATGVGLTVAFAVVYVRNVGPSPIGVALTPAGVGVGTVYALDAGAMLLFAASQALSSIIVSGTTTPGISIVTVSTNATGTADVELLVAG
jgi:hypothetical protein